MNGHGNRLGALVVLFVGATLLNAYAASGADVEIREVKDEAGKVVAAEVLNLPADDLKAFTNDEHVGTGTPTFAIYLANEDRSKIPALAGSLSVEKQVLRFTPAFPLRKGMKFVAVYQGAGAKEKTLEIAIPEGKAVAATRVAQVYPTAHSLPENQLKFYLHFSAPMSRGEAYPHLAIIDETTGAEVDAPFLEIGEELWDPSGKRLTLLIDPGRIKKGVKPREDLGTVFEAGRRYSLLIRSGWRDANGKELEAPFKKTFEAAPAIEVGMDLKSWQVQSPMPGSREPLQVTFLQPLDHALLERTLTVVDASGETLEGKVAVSNEERLWAFEPKNAWKAGVYQLVIDTVLEDLAGNHVGEAFEVDQLTPIEKKVDVRSVQLPFTIEAAK